MNDYGFYLFSRLYVDLVLKENRIEYDVEFDIVSKLYLDFMSSDYNQSSKDLYSCIVHYFIDNGLLDWFEVHCTLEDGSTETMASFNSLKEALEFMKIDPTLKVDQWRINPHTQFGEIIKYHNDLMNLNN